MIHSGSRNLGKQVAEIYQQLAIDLHMGKEAYFQKREEIIRTCKEAGRRGEIQAALKVLKREFETQELDAPRDICWLWGSYLEAIIDVIRDSVDIIDIMKPVFNFKASHDEVPWKKKA